MGENESISLRQLAKEAGVSVGTASQALRGTGSTSAKTRERICQLARDLGYKRDLLMAHAGARRRAKLKGPTQLPVMLLSGKSSEDYTYFPKLRYRDECKAELSARGFQFWEANCEVVSDLRRTLREFYFRGGRGILLNSLQHEAWLNEVDWSPFSVIYLGGFFYKPVFNTVCLSYPQALNLVITEALTLSKRVGIVLHHHGENQVFDDCLRLGVAINHLNAAPEKFAPLLRLDFAVPFEEQVAILKDWLLANQPQVLVGFHAVKTLLSYSGCSSLPIFIPAADSLPPNCAGCLEDSLELVKLAVNMLEGMLQRREMGIPLRPNLITLSPKLACTASDLVCYQ